MEDDMTWEDIIRRANVSEYKDYYVSQNVYYPEVGAKPVEEIPKYMYMLQHTDRSQNFSQNCAAAKSIVRTERVLSIFNHYPTFCLTDEHHQCYGFTLPTSTSQNSHYRDHLDKNTMFHVTRKDKTIWKYKNQLQKAVQETLKATNFVP
jgi:hypothetical protein